MYSGSRKGYENVINLDVGGWGPWRYGVGLGKPPDSGLLIFRIFSHASGAPGWFLTRIVQILHFWSLERLRK